MPMYPLIFDPIYKPKIWGGDLIFTHFARSKTTPEPIGESWELADLETDQSKVRAGRSQAKSLGQIRAEWGTKLIGSARLFEGRFPLLIKFLDAQSALSVQVHPSEAMARRFGGNVRIKHEAWYILAATKEGCIYHGLEPGIEAAAFRDAMLTGKVEGVLRKVPVKPGECYYLPSGTPHALGAGVLVAEIQTPSDITYRTYDWGRIDPVTGRPRELHLDQAMDCIDFTTDSPPPMQSATQVDKPWATSQRVCACASFNIDKTTAGKKDSITVAYPEMLVWVMLKGEGELNWPTSRVPIVVRAGDVAIIPAGLTECRADFPKGATWLEVSVPAGDEIEPPIE